MSLYSPLASNPLARVDPWGLDAACCMFEEVPGGPPICIPTGGQDSWPLEGTRCGEACEVTSYCEGSYQCFPESVEVRSVPRSPSPDPCCEGVSCDGFEPSIEPAGEPTITATGFFRVWICPSGTYYTTVVDPGSGDPDAPETDAPIPDDGCEYEITL